MSRRVLRLEIPVFPERMMFRVHDPVAELDVPGGPLPPVDALISAGRDQLLVSCAQEHLGVQLTVDMGSAGPAVAGLRLSGGVGDYGVRIYTRNRAAALQSYADLFQQHADPLSDEFQQARKQLEGMEQYLLQLWRES